MKHLPVAILALMSVCPVDVVAGSREDDSINDAPRIYEVDERRFVLDYYRKRLNRYEEKQICIRYREVEGHTHGEARPYPLHPHREPAKATGAKDTVCGLTLRDALDAFTDRIHGRM